MINIQLDPLNIENEYFAHLIGLGGGADSALFFGDPEQHYQPEVDEFYMGLLINSYSVSEYESYETHFLLGSWIAEALGIEFTHSYPCFRQRKLDILYAKPNYEEVKQSVIEEVRRIYNETQLLLNQLYPKIDELYLVRTLNYQQHDQYSNGQEITYNFITSYCPTLSHTYPGNRKIIRAPINKKKILAYTNLSYGGQSLGNLENEVIVIHSDELN